MHHADPERGAGIFVPQGLGEAAHRELACRVSRLARRGDDAVEARQVDDLRRRPASPAGQEGVGHPHHGAEIDVHQPVDIGEFEIGEAAGQSHAGIVDQQVEGPVPGRDRVGQGGDAVSFREVEAMGADLAPQRPHGGLAAGETVGIAVDEDEAGAPAGEAQGQGRADAAAGPGDQGQPVVQWEGVRQQLAPSGPVAMDIARAGRERKGRAQGAGRAPGLRPPGGRPSAARRRSPGSRRRRPAPW